MTLKKQPERSVQVDTGEKLYSIPERVSPKEIENTLCEIDGVVESTVIGVPDEIFGQAIKVFIVPRTENKLTEDQVIKYCMKNLEPFMVPKYVEFTDSLPKSPTGKIDKKKLK